LAPVPRFFEHAGYRTSVVSDFAGDIFRRVDLGYSHVLAPTFDMDELIRARQIEAQKLLLPFFRGRLARTLVPTLRELHTASDAQALTRDALAEVDRAKDRPFFLTVFYSTAHFPYAAPAPFYRRFTEPGYRGRFRYSKAELLGTDPRPTPADIRQIRGLYDGAVLAADQAIGELIDGIIARGRSENTIIVATSDHGECLFEPGRGQGHGDHLFGDQATAIPLVIYDPRHARPHKQPDVVRSIDIAPTLCELAKVTCPAAMDGRSLVPLLEGKSLPPLPAFAETGLWFTETIPDVPPNLRMPYPDLTYITEVLSEHHNEIVLRKIFEPITTTAKHRMMREARYKLLYLPTRDRVVWRLYDTIFDPNETRDLSSEQPAVLARLQDQFWRWMLEDPDMERRNEYLMPRAGQLSQALTASKGVRVEDAH
jgi:hypothetical protein